MNKSRSKTIFHILIFCALLASLLGVTVPASAAGICYVNDNASGANDGTSWADAYTSLQSALGISSPCTETWVAAGTYKPHANDRTASFSLIGGTALYGGFAGTETLRSQRDPVANVTILSGDVGIPGDGSDNSYHVIYLAFISGNPSILTVLDGFTITGGHAANSNDQGGGMLIAANDSNLMLTNLIFSGNSATTTGGGIMNAFNSSLTLTNVTFSDNSALSGGGMYNDSSSATLTNVTFSGNSATSNGGAVDNENSNPILTNVTFSDNSASYGGGMFNYQSNPTLTNITFGGNSATNKGGGIYNNTSSPTLTNITFKGNSADQGGGMDNETSDPQIINTIFWGNTASTGGTQILNANSTPILSDSVVQDGCPAWSTCTNIITTDPMLDVLGNYGGPTQTFAVLTGSPAIDAGTDTGCPADDQRGTARPIGAHCDIGAYEANIVTNTNDSGAGSLRAGIAAATNGDTITFAAALSGQTITLTSIQLEILKNVTIDGHALASKITISGNSSTRVFVVDVGVTATLDSLIITQGWVEGCCGAGLLNYGTLTITNSLFSANTNDNGTGGAIMNIAPGALTLTGSTISGNSAFNGGGIGNANQMTITNSTISANSSGDAGGGIHNNGGTATLTVTNSTFSGNTASTNGFGSGGGIYSSAPLTVRNSTFSGNSAMFDAGGIAQDGGTLNLSNTIIANSSLNGSPGADCRTQSAIGINTNNLLENGGCANNPGGDPSLDPLANNGGPTQTFALLANSPAIDAGDDTTCAAFPVSNLDQRGIARPNGGHCDIGAYEYVDTTPPTVAFSVPASPTVLNIPITFTASDDAILTGYLITESATPPTLGNAGWTASAPTIYPVASMGSYTLYPWAKDAAGHVSAVYGSGVSVNITCLDSITVTSNADSGPGSLRQAISDTCDGGTINFNASLSGDTIHLDTTLDISRSLTIDGSSLTSKITISGDSGPTPDGTGDVRVFHTTTSTFATVTLNSLIITKGLASGPHIPNRDDEGGGLFNDIHTTVNIVNSLVSDNVAINGGAISVYGTVNITDSTFSGNSSTGGGGGGAILNSQVLTIRNSTFSNNTANDGGGGALFNTSPNTSITNSTFFGNTAGLGGAITTTGDLNITNSTISDNSAYGGGGIAIQGHTTNLINTIIANSITRIGGSGLAGDCLNFDTIGTNLNNLIEDGSCSPSLSGDPGLAAALANNGGPTQTLALLSGSNAIDAGDDTICAAAVGFPNYGAGVLDQRGISRPNSAHCDIGAYEYADASAPLVTAFTVPSPANNLNIPIAVFNASDDATVAGYQITQTSTPPLAGAAGWMVSAPTTYTVAGDGSYTLYPWVKDAVGNVSALYGSPVTVSVDSLAPTVVSSNLVNASPTNATSVDFTVTFSEDVSGVDTTDFSLYAPGISGASVSSVSGSGTTRTVTVNTGSRNGTIRLDVLDDNSIQDVAGNPLNGAFSSGPAYTIDKTITLTLQSNSAQDGVVLELSERSKIGGTINANIPTFNVGDDTTNRQYLGILSFSTGAGLPDTAVITGVTLKVMKKSIVGGGNPVSTFNGFMVDIKNGVFGTAVLQAADFQTKASKSYGPFKPASVSNWYSMDLTGGSAFINKLASSSGLTQIRLRFKLDDNNNSIANYLALYSGNAPRADRPQLVISYYIP